MKKKKNKIKTGQKPAIKGRVRKKIRDAFRSLTVKLLRKYPNHSGQILQESFNSFLATTFLFISSSNIKTEDLILFLKNRIDKLQNIIDDAENIMSRHRFKNIKQEDKNDG